MDFDYQKAVGDRRNTLRARGAKGTTAGGLVVGFLFLGLIAAALSGAVIMWCFGAIHEDIPSVPAIGFVSGLAVFVLAATLGTAFKGVTFDGKSS